MHIKQVILSGFRSFRSQSEIEPFSPKHNVIIGRNGSGKSNFFAAIQFALLSQNFMHLRQEERQQLLHEGAGANVMSAFVEVVFDNSDGRMTVEGDEVVLRRMIGAKKDEFFLNRKRVTKQEVSSLLESAGFSRSNPYYIVQQGKVNHLTLMRDEQRLDLLKEVAGTKVYEERREESLQIIKETNHKREKINEVVAYIDERLRELDEEKEELKAYQQLDKDRRALEYTLYDKELKQAREELGRSEESRLREVERADSLHRELHDTRDALNSLEEKVSKLADDLERKEADRQEVEREREALIAERERCANEEADLVEKIERDETEQEDLKKRLVKLDKEIAETKKTLAERVEPEFKSAQKAVEDLKKQLHDRERLKSELYDKQGRRSAFKSVEERDRHLKSQMSEIEKSISDRESLIRKNESEREKHLRTIEVDKAQIERKSEEIGEKQAAVALLGEEETKMTYLRNEKLDEKKRKMELVTQLEEERNALTDKLRKAEKDLRYSMPRHIAHGLESVQRLVEEGNVRGYYGPVYQLITLKDPKFATAVEVAAGNSLFNVVVDNDETAAKLMKKLEERNLGRVCFMPLNRLRVRDVHYPNSEDVVPLLEHAMTYPREVDRAMRQIFGRKLLARDLETASRFSDSANIDCITLDGDEANRKGSMQGGYHDASQSKLAQVVVIREARAELEPLEERLSVEKTAQQQLDMEVQKLLADTHKKSRDSGSLRNEIDTLSREMKNLSSRIEMLKGAVEKIEESLPTYRSEVEDMRKQLQAYTEEVGTALDTALTAAETRTLQEIEADIPRLGKELKAANKALSQKKEERMKLTYRLEENLSKSREKVLESLAPEAGGSGHSQTMELMERKRQLELKKAEMKQVTRKVQAVEARLKQMDEQGESQQSEQKQLKQQAEERRAEEARIKAQIAEVSKGQEKLTNKRSMALQKRDNSLKKIQELGSLPAAELELYKGYGIKQLYKQLHDCNEKLKRYSHVNKKALDQYINFSDQRSELLQRKKELDDGSEAIQNLIDNLDRQKDEAIIRTFRGVSKHFSDVFKELVPNGYGRMVMRTTADKLKDVTADDDDDDDEDESGPSENQPMRVSEFVGIQIQVSFTGTGDRYLMQQLSGGQKALVALALIFSIQRCDPAPFYLFDEVDQALDSTYRAAVAALIQRQANSEDNPAQFITSTFRPELVRVADRCYGISHQNKVSNIDILDKETALEFVRELQEEEEAVGGAASKRVGKAKGKTPTKQQPVEEEDDQQEEEEEEAEDMDVDEEDGEDVDEEDEDEADRRRRSSKGSSSSKKRKASSN